ncbi:DUF885 domain-containing protein [Permianibacter sp. IMCC34836]|uniref:DUF885 domain-containing protein n=1 Tax=Permianibacter fluminis TaxID=2738515 RepID=UPI00155218A3|nr:DUF885 domain-containing protein [Permianibacter fluminis]NQD38818.1 DUF885 domain-containing protein [Permianibacter fluminis]
MMRILKWLGILLASVFGLLLIAATWGWYGRLPFDMAINRAFLQFVLESPETLSQLRMLESMGITFHQDDLDDESVEAGDRMISKMNKMAEEFKSYDRDSLSYQQQLTYDMGNWFVDKMKDGADKWRYHNYPVNQLFGVQNGFPTFMESAHQVNSVGDAEDYNSRLSKIGVKFGQVIDGLKLREQKGIIPPTFVLEKVIAEIDGFVNTPAEQNILYSSFEKKLTEAKSIEAADKTRLLADAKQQIETTVYPAYRNLMAFLVEQKPKSTADAGVWKLPEGDAFYAYVLEMFTTSTMKPEEVHQLGLQEVERIQAEMRVILAEQVYDTTQPVGVLMRKLGEEERFLYADTPEAREQILKDYQTIIDQVSAGLDPVFSVKPKSGVKVERIPEFKEKTAPGAYYNQPAMDGSRPGIFYANLYDIKATPKFDMRTLAYHEAVPGHHFQVSIAQENTELPLFRRMAPFTAYVEGWALYAERLAWEAGFQNDPFDNLGRLQAELFRAVRLVVDTGMHAKRWTREQAIDYMIANTGMADSDVTAEIERYIVMPGQACAYKVGMIEILKLREEAKAKLGSKFDIREFHSVVLKNGAMPLFLLRKVVEEWVAGQQSA